MAGWGARQWGTTRWAPPSEALLVGLSSPAASVNGTLQRSVSLTAVSSAQVNSFTSLRVARSLIGQSAATTSVSGQLVGVITLTANALGSSSTTGALRALLGLKAGTTLISSSTANLLITRGLIGDVNAALAVAGMLGVFTPGADVLQVDWATLNPRFVDASSVNPWLEDVDRLNPKIKDWIIIQTEYAE